MTDAPTTQRTLVLVKPDGVRRGLSGEIVRRIEAKGYTLVAVELREPSEALLAEPAAVWWVGGTLSVTLIVLSGLMTRPGGYVAGTVVQVLVLGVGFFVPMMFVVGGIFVVLWIVALRLGGRIDRERAEYDAAHPGAVGP